MKTTLQNMGSRFPFSSGPDAMDNGALLLTLAASAALAFAAILLLYALISANPLSSRLPFGLFVTLVPAVAVVGVIKLTRQLISRRGVVLFYFVLFALFLLLQAVGRLIPVHS
ncbi:MAG TPA: hypothetical protein VFI24_22385 [Pyrinomonadaceae bacterium]|nr:hypothetical protein [Pyrinomonadaceae bacterium]